MVAVRELDRAGSRTQRNWNNLHTVYTHGYGVVAAYGNQRDAENSPVTTAVVRLAERDIPPEGELTDLFEDGYEPRIYFGERSADSYSIVGEQPATPRRRARHPGGHRRRARPRQHLRRQPAGVPIGGLFNKLLYAVKFADLNILLSEPGQRRTPRSSTTAPRGSGCRRSPRG